MLLLERHRREFWFAIVLCKFLKYLCSILLLAKKEILFCGDDLNAMEKESCPRFFNSKES